MRIAWVTPLAESSAIGRFSAGVVAELTRQGAEPDIFRSEMRAALDEQQLAIDRPVFRLADLENFSALRRYDIVVYNFGDDLPFHYFAVKAANAVPGLGICHDCFYGHLFRDWSTTTQAEARLPATPAAGKRSGKELPAASDSRLEWLASRTIAAVSHGRHYFRQLATSCPGPTWQLPLACDRLAGIPPPRLRTRSSLNLGTIGEVKPNERPKEIIRAIGASTRLKQACTYSLVGQIGPDAGVRLKRLAKSLGVSMSIVRAATRQELGNEIASLDALLCLRKPTREGASASTIESMLSGRPVVVMDHGFYSELPDDLVLKVRPNLEAEDLTRQLTRLLDEPDETRAMGLRGAIWAADHFSFARYASALASIMNEAVGAAPLVRLGTQLGRELATLGLQRADPSVDRIARIATDLFCPGAGVSTMSNEAVPERADAYIAVAMRNVVPNHPGWVPHRSEVNKIAPRGFRKMSREISRPFEKLAKMLRSVRRDTRRKKGPGRWGLRRAR